MKLSRETILNIALEIERNGIAFYEKVGGRLGGNLAEFLIGEEKKHIRAFQDLFSGSKSAVPAAMETDRLDDDYLIAAYGGTGVFGLVNSDRVDERGLLDVAIGMEKSSVAFYAELIASLAPQCAEATKLAERIQGEERAHLRMLAERKRALGG